MTLSKKGLGLDEVDDLVMEKFAHVFNAIPMDIDGDFQCVVPERKGICVEYGDFFINFEGDGSINFRKRRGSNVSFSDVEKCVEHILETYN